MSPNYTLLLHHVSERIILLEFKMLVFKRPASTSVVRSKVIDLYYTQEILTSVYDTYVPTI